MALKTYIALLRGINVGGKNKVPMKSLASMFDDQGCRKVQTYIQTGNVVFQAEEDSASRLPNLISKSISGQLGLSIPVVIRSADELADVIRANPFASTGHDPKKLHVAFLAHAPGETDIASLDPRRSPPDQFVVRGKEIYLWCPDGLGRSKLTNAYFDSKLKTISTVRTWRTSLKLLALARAQESPA